MLYRYSIFFVLLFSCIFCDAQIDCFDRANQYRSKYLEQTSIDFDTLNLYLRKGEKMLTGCSFPNDTFQTVKNSKHTIKEYQGKVLVINFWSIHCPPCINEIPSFHALEKKYSKLVVVAATLDSKREIETWLKKHEFRAEIVPEAISFVHRYSLGNGYPFTIVVDPQGRIIHTRSGGETGKEHHMDLYKELDSIVEKAFSGQ